MAVKKLFSIFICFSLIFTAIQPVFTLAPPSEVTNNELQRALDEARVHQKLLERKQADKSNYPRDLKIEDSQLYTRALELGIALPLLMLAGVDGWGIDKDDNTVEKDVNLFTKARTPNYWRLWNDPTVWKARLITVGKYLQKIIPEHQGSSEKGWHYLGTGMETTRQDIVLKAIDEGEYNKNEAFLGLMKRIKKRQEGGEEDAALHIMAPILTDKGVHHYDLQVHKLIEMAAAVGLKKNVYVWVGSDGRDASKGRPISQYIHKLYDVMEKNGVGEIAGVFGRDWLDRAGDFDLTKKIYDFCVHGMLIEDDKYVGESIIVDNNDRETIIKAVSRKIEEQVSAGKTEQTMKSVGVRRNGQMITINDKDGLIWSTFRSDRARMPIFAFTADRVNPDIYPQKTDEDYQRVRESFLRNFGDEPLLNLDIATVFRHYDNMPDNIAVAFEDAPVSTHLVKELVKRGYRVLIVTEATKENFMQAVFMGRDTADYTGKCDFKIFPSVKDSLVSEHPEMASADIRDYVLEQMKKGIYDVIITNICPPDMVTHMGEREPTIKAIEATDAAAGPIMDQAVAQGGTGIEFSDHGSADRVFEEIDGKLYPDPAHTDNDIPLMLVTAEPHRVEGLALRSEGRLIDFPSTILHFLDGNTETIPMSWEGNSLLCQQEIAQCN